MPRPRSQEAVDEAIRKAERSARRELVKRVASRNEAELQRIFERMAPAIRRDLKAVGYTEAQVAEVLRTRFRETFDARVREIEAAIMDGARTGVEGDRRAFDKVLGGKEAATRAPFASAPPKTRE